MTLYRVETSGVRCEEPKKHHKKKMSSLKPDQLKCKCGDINAPSPSTESSESDPSSDLSEATLETRRTEITRSGSQANLLCGSIKTPFRIVTTLVTILSYLADVSGEAGPPTHGCKEDPLCPAECR